MSKLIYTSLSGKTDTIIDDVMSLPESQDEDSFKLRLIVEELVTNIVHYAYPEGEDGEMTVCAERDTEGLTLTFADSGIAFNPLAKDDPDIDLTAEERPIGGLGIFIVKQMARDVEYKHEEGKNILTVKV